MHEDRCVALFKLAYYKYACSSNVGVDEDVSNAPLEVGRYPCISLTQSGTWYVFIHLYLYLYLILKYNLFILFYFLLFFFRAPRTVHGGQRSIGAKNE